MPNSFRNGCFIYKNDTGSIRLLILLPKKRYCGYNTYVAPKFYWAWPEFPPETIKIHPQRTAVNLFPTARWDNLDILKQNLNSQLELKKFWYLTSQTAQLLWLRLKQTATHRTAVLHPELWTERHQRWSSLWWGKGVSLCMVNEQI